MRGPSISPGYFRKASCEKGSFQKRREDDGGENAELATGDLGYIAGDQLFVVDRIKDLIIIAGTNYAPSDIEHYIVGVDGIRRGAAAAFACQGDDGTEGLHIVAELDPKCLRSPEEVEKEIRKIVRVNFGLTATDILLVPPRSLPKTSSGKIRRHKTRKIYERHEFDSMQDLTTRLAAQGEFVGKRVKRWIAAVFG